MDHDTSKTRRFTSQMFGPTRDETEYERAVLEQLLNDVPVAYLATFNRRLDSIGLMCSFAHKVERPAVVQRLAALVAAELQGRPFGEESADWQKLVQAVNLFFVSEMGVRQ